jgi:hypothetical protein
MKIVALAEDRRRRTCQAPDPDLKAFGLSSSERLPVSGGVYCVRR